MKAFLVLLLTTHFKKALGYVCDDGTDTSTYAGTAHITDGGRVCQPWHEQRPHQHKYDESSFPHDASIYDAQNFCRNPDIDPDSWCYTSDPFTRWQYCYRQICGHESATCGGIRQTNDYHQISYFVKMNYVSYDCLWTLQAPSDRLVSLAVMSVDLECDENNYIQIYETGFYHGKFCSNVPMLNITSGSNVLNIQFKCYNCFKRGFHVMFDHMLPTVGTKVLDPSCGDVITEPHGIIQNRDRDGDGMYDVMDYCIWNIMAPVDTLIKLDFEMLELESDLHCSKDFLEVYDTIAILCGETAPGLYIMSSYNNVSLRFLSDFNTTGLGFRLSISHINISMPDLSATLPDKTPQRPVDITIVTGVNNFSLETVTGNYEPKILGTSKAAQRVNVTSGFCPLYGCDAVSFVCFFWVYMLFVMKHALQG